MVKILELFSGYGTASFALKRLHIPYECVGYSDIDKYANQCFRQNHSNSSDTELGTLTWYPNELGNVKEVDPNQLEDFDLLTGGFPCQAFSVAGKGLGELDPRGTLFWEIVRIAEVKKPRYMLLENVKGLVSKKHKPTFDKILSELERIGYYVHWKVLNTKDYGIPQNRERVWFVCFRDKSEYDSFTWPEKEELKIFIKDILESEPVDKKFYLNDNQIQKVLDAIKKKMELGISKTIRSGGRNSLTPKHEWDIVNVEWNLNKDGLSSQQNRPYSVDGESPTLGTNGSPKIFQLDKGVLRRGEWGTGYHPNISGTLNCSSGNDFINSINGVFRRLTPKECFRLQGFLNDEINLEGLSDTQAYKLAGNGQSVNVVAKIFERMFK